MSSYLLTKLIPGLKEYAAAEEFRSDSENGSYLLSVRKAVSNYRHFKNFKRDRAYNKILEHVSREEGAVYFQILKERNDSILESALDTLLKTDEIGSPRKYEYEGRMLSSTTLRYLKVASDLKRLFGDSIGKKVVEIGGGYGGQLLVCDTIFQPDEYHVFDLPDVNRLASKYLESFLLSGSYEVHTLNAAGVDSYDMVISNYAFSEVPSEVQKTYIRKILANSKCGYLTMNSGMSDHAGKEDAKLSLEALKSSLPSFEIFEENPKTAEHNYIIVWGHREGATL